MIIDPRLRDICRGSPATSTIRALSSLAPLNDYWLNYLRGSQSIEAPDPSIITGFSVAELSLSTFATSAAFNRFIRRFSPLFGSGAALIFQMLCGAYLFLDPVIAAAHPLVEVAWVF